jgi:hypothetical protein
MKQKEQQETILCKRFKSFIFCWRICEQVSMLDQTLERLPKSGKTKEKTNLAIENQNLTTMKVKPTFECVSQNKIIKLSKK